ncbi:hypothetical protein GCM10007939_17880 [Amylibacter marinus]|uniref:Glycosyl transferase family 1 domain-containing protein n=1 Tax=Amylibacter marinus TaxID=1475483 RepID=A0ABQ5VVY9_9RHOB|nr:glycosyltransferase family 1 protein [Amylibacter marinus]GLQ35505.1 hypothetical protein GCM10007939_17880 [Amylibacter marinus]
MNLILDITRFVSRFTMGHDTGIDRVMRAAVLDALDRCENPYFVYRSKRVHFLFDRHGMQRLLRMSETNQWQRARGIDRLRFKRTKLFRRILTSMRDLALMQARLAEIITNLRGQFDGPFTYFNPSHSNLSDSTMSDLKAGKCDRVMVMIHDVIPIDFPEFCNPEVSQRFDRMLGNVAKYADQIICNSEYTEACVQRVIRVKNPRSVCETSVHYLVHTVPDLDSVMALHINDRPSFLCLGTIEPRKNIQMLLNIWENYGKTLPTADIPNLLLVGKRGWETQEFFHSLDNHPMRGQHIFEYNNFSDQQVASALKASKALLFPSYVEGFGLPAIEALACGRDVICSDIPVFQEILPRSGEFIPATAQNRWAETILRYASKNNTRTVDPVFTDMPAFVINWTHFFNSVYSNHRSYD